MISWSKTIECALGLCRDDRGLVVVLHLLGLQIDIARGLYIFYQPPSGWEAVSLVEWECTLSWVKVNVGFLRGFLDWLE